MKINESLVAVSVIILGIIFFTFIISQLGKNTWTTVLLLALFGAIGAFGFYKFRNAIILELGFIGMAADVVWELYGTGNQLWTYYQSPFYMLGGTLPIEVVILYFCLGMTAATYVLYRLDKK